MPEPEFQPTWFSRPGDTVVAMMAQRKLDSRELASRLGVRERVVAGLIDGTETIGADLAERLSDGLGGSVRFWIARQRQYEASLNRASDALPELTAKTWLRTLPVRDMINSGWLPDCKGKEAIKAALAYFEVEDPEEWRERYASFANGFSFRTSTAFESRLGALAAWLRQGEIQASTIQCAKWDAEEFRAALSAIRKLTRQRRPSSFIPKLRALCAAAGVAVVFVPAPSGCRASGATRFIAADRAMMVLSFRYLSDDHFWFTFFHEAGHLLLHGRGDTFVDGGDEVASAKEDEANQFSARTLINPHDYEALIHLRHRQEDVLRFALRIGVSAGIVVGQMQHNGFIGPHQLNWLKRRYSREEISEAIANL
jgi:plasmid maintenance system antidote protein VapI/Zn-dependent peptidase ImmA (M78 family)